MPKVFKNADFVRVAYSIFVLVAVCVAVISFVSPAEKVKAQKFKKNSGKSSPPGERLATTPFPTSSALPAAIPDNAPTPGLNLPIPVSGLTDDLRGVAVNISFNPTHTWLGDLRASLSAPGGSPTHQIFWEVGNTSGTSSGDSSDMTGPYLFTDGTTGDLWSVAAGLPNGSSVPSSSYRTTGALSAAFTDMNPVFQGPVLTENIANGTWNFYIGDRGGGDSGSVSALSLVLTTLAPTAGFAGIRGTVVTPAGRPISHARVSILNAETLETFTAVTNNFGYFTFESLPVENFYTMWVEHGRYQFEKQVQSFVLIGDIENARFISLTQ